MVSDDEQIGNSEKFDGMELEIDDLEYFVTDRRWHAKERYNKPIIEARVPDHHLKYILVSRQVAVDRRKVRKAENIIARRAGAAKRRSTNKSINVQYTYH